MNDQPGEISLAALRHADSAALTQFAEATYADLYRWFHWLALDEHTAADLTQSASTSFWRSLEQPGAPREPHVSARVWLFAIGRNVWRKRCRQKRTNSHECSNEHLIAVRIAEGDTPPEALAKLEQDAVIRQAVAALPEANREAITLRYWQQLSYADIAKVLGISESNARQRVHQARNTLKSQLKPLLNSTALTNEAKS